MTKLTSTTDSRPANLRDAQKQSTRKLLIESAASLFQSQGFAATSIDDIARSAGATRATFYLHFKTKADVIDELVEGISTEAAALTDQLVDAVRAGDRQSIHAWLSTAFDFWELVRNTSKAEEEAAMLHPQVSKARARSFDRGVTAIVTGLEQAGRWDATGRQVRGVLAYSQLQNLFHRWLRVGWDVDRSEILEVMTDMWLAAFGTPPAQ